MPQYPQYDPLLDCVEIEPADRPADAAVIWLHGLGADGNDFAPIVPELGLSAEHHIRFVFPNAPHIPVTLNGGMVMPAWYDVYGLDLQDRQDATGIRASARHVEGLIARENERGVATERIVLAGFSQGGAIALQAGLRHERRLAGLLVLSAWLPLSGTLADERSDANREIPILQCHGIFDPMVAEVRGRESAGTLRKLGYDVRYETYPMQHQVCLEEIELVGAWLAERLPAVD